MFLQLDELLPTDFAAISPKKDSSSGDHQVPFRIMTVPTQESSDSLYIYMRHGKRLEKIIEDRKIRKSREK